MPKTILVLFAAVLIYIVFFGSVACWLLPIGDFRSLTTRSEIQVLPLAGTDPMQYLAYRTTISFREGQFIQQESDYFFSGPYTCRFGRITASHSNATAVSTGYTPLLGVLLWDGTLYVNLIQVSLLLLLLLVGYMNRERFRRGQG